VRSTLAEVHLSAAVRDTLATDRLRATDEMAVFGTDPCKRSSGLARGFPDSHVEKEHWQSALLLLVHLGSEELGDRGARCLGETGEFAVSAHVHASDAPVRARRRPRLEFEASFVRRMLRVWFQP
jgi:hypothetical protein